MITPFRPSRRSRVLPLAILGCGLIALIFPARPSAALPEKDPLAPFAWLAGDWSGDDAGVWNEELWTEPAGGMMLAVHRDLSDGKATADGIIYFASPGGNPATPFPMIESGGQRIVFENPKIEFPTRILYWLGKGGELHARIEGTPGGQPKSKEWTWKRRATK
jgi:Domain of unknown function (DUF6265)